MDFMVKAKKYQKDTTLGNLAFDFNLSAREISRQTKLLGNNEEFYINHSTINDYLTGDIPPNLKSIRTLHKIFKNIDSNLPLNRLFDNEIPRYSVAFKEYQKPILELPDLINDPTQAIILLRDGEIKENIKAIISYRLSEKYPHIKFFETINVPDFEEGFAVVFNEKQEAQVTYIFKNKKGLLYCDNFIEGKQKINSNKIYPISSMCFRNFEIIDTQ